jgi:predicted aspartyl protease
MISRKREWGISGMLIVILVGLLIVKGLPHHGKDRLTRELNEMADFVEINGHFERPYFLVNVLAKGPKPLSFVLDTGWKGRSVISKAVANQLGFKGKSAHCQLLLEDGSKLDFDADLSDNLTTVNSRRTDGTVGLELLRKHQLLLDYQNGTVWCRSNPTTLTYNNAALALAIALEPAGLPHVAEVPLKVGRDGSYTTEVDVGTHHTRGIIDTGATAIYVDPKFIDDWGLPKLVDIHVDTPFGTESDGVFMAPNLKVAGFPHYWPVLRSSPNEPETGITIGASYLPSRQVVIDFPGKFLYFKPPIEANLLNQAVREYFNRSIGVFEDKLRMDWSNPSKRYPSLEFSLIEQVQGLPASEWIQMLTAFSKGDPSGLPKLEHAYEQTFTKEDLLVLFNGKHLHFPAAFP